MVRALSGRYRAVRPDLGVSFEETRSQLDSLVMPGAVLCGYSMGGRVALDWVVSRSPSLSHLVLISSSPGIADDAERRVRRAADDALADRIEGMGIEAFVEEWERTPVLAGSPEWLHEDRLRGSTSHFAAQLRGLGTGFMEPLWDRLASLQVPVLWIVGGRDAKFRAIAERTGQPIHVVPNAGHAVHAEHPEVVAALLDALR